MKRLFGDRRSAIVLLTAVLLLLVGTQAVLLAQNLGAAPQTNVAVQGQTGAQPEDFLKTICMIGQEGQLIAAVVLGSYRASTTRVGEALNIPRPEIATAEQALEKTGYLVGGIAPFGYEATFLIDPLVMEKEVVYVGGGAPSALTKISPKEILRLNKGTVLRIRK